MGRIGINAHLGALGGVALLAAGGALGLGQTPQPAARAARGAVAPAAMPAMPAMPAMRMARAASDRGPTARLHQRVVRVTIRNFAFQPARLIVSPGTRVIWTNADSDPHTVTSTQGLWRSDALDTDGRFARVFRAAGTFPYYCSIHPYMHGTVIVKR